jgi:TolB-like protein/DNA-binding winged helix-turn-helix (wHTH) protein/Flp pilus assembly protein TadD
LFVADIDPIDQPVPALSVAAVADLCLLLASRPGAALHSRLVELPVDPTAHRLARFGVFELDRISGELRKQGLRIRLPEQPLQVLLLLLEHAGETVTRDELRRRLWPAETFVDFDAGLNSAIKKLRDALGDPSENPRFIETLPRRGYRFIGPVEEPAIGRREEGAPSPAPGFSRLRQNRWLLTATLAAPLAIAAWFIFGDAREWLSARTGLAAGPRRIMSIAVLPFENLTGITDQDYFVDGMTEALTTNLAQFKTLRVSSRTSAMQYRRRDKPLSQIAGELNVDAVVEGAVVRSGNRVRVTAQLIEAVSDRHLWAQNYEREVRDVLGLQIELAEAIATAIRLEVRPEERRRLTRSQAVKPEAYDEYLKGRFYWSSRGPENLLRAAEHFQTSIERDPTYAPAYSGLSDTYRLFDVHGLAAPRECMPKAEAAAREALALDDTLAEAHASLAGVLYRYHWNWAEAEKEFRRTLELDPSYAEGYRAQAVFFLMLRRSEDAVTAARRARELSPLSPVINIELASALTSAGRYEEAIEQFRKTQQIAPDFPRLTERLALAHLRMGDRGRAFETLEGAALPPSSWRHGYLGYLYGIQGRREEARKVLTELKRRAWSQYVSPQLFAAVHLGLGEDEQALSLLEKAYEERAFEVIGFSGLLAEILLDNPRFQQLLRRMGLAGEPGYAPRRAGR